jgi:hypothetical protein
MAAPIRRPNPLDQALRFLAMGLSVIPVHDRDKKPTVPWKPYQERLATEAEVRGWFGGTTPLNVGIVTGAVSGVVVLDADSPQATEWMVAHRNSPMRTKTGKGRHFWFRHPGTPVKNDQKTLGMPLDVRGDGGYVVAPGSIHPSGALYEEDGTWDVAQIPKFELAWLGQRKPVTKPAPKVQTFSGATDRDQRVMAYIETLDLAVEGEAGDTTTFRNACKIARGFNLTEDEALAYLSGWNARCSPPWSEADLRKKIQSALRYGSEPMGYLLPGLAIRPESWRPPAKVHDGQPAEEGGTGSMLEKLTKDKNGRPRRTPGNLAKIIRFDPAWGPALRLNLMSQDITFEGRIITDSFADFVQEQLEDHFGIAWGREDVSAKIRAQAEAAPFHPVRDWLVDLPRWDGTERIHRLAAEVLHAEDQPLAPAMLRGTLVAAVRRAMEPGCKVDTVLVLAGPQGWGKSTFWRILAGAAWFGDSSIDLESKDAYLVLARRWIFELPEVDHAISTKAAERIKGFISSSEDTYRPPYGRTVQVFPRSSIIVGTTNRDGFLADPTGSRRFWPIKLGAPADIALLTRWREQLWAEAFDLYRNGAQHWLDQGQDTMREAESERFEASDPWEDLVDTALGVLARAGHIPLDGYALGDLLTSMGVPVSQQNRAASMRLAEILKGRGWVRRLHGTQRRARWYSP